MVTQLETSLSGHSVGDLVVTQLETWWSFSWRLRGHSVGDLVVT